MVDKDLYIALWNLRLQIKCDQYWPTRGIESYGIMHVMLIDVVELATYTIRTFQLQRVRHGRLSGSINFFHLRSPVKLTSFLNDGF